MRITASVLRGFIRETLLREASLGPVPAAPGTVVRNKSVLKKLQAINGAAESDRYDAQTELAWDEFIDKNVNATALTGDATIDTIKSDWSTAAKDITYQGDTTMKFTPDIKGMLNFAMIVEPVNAETAQTVAGEALPTGPYRTADQPDVWPTGVTLDDAEKWDVFIESKYLFVLNISPVEMYDAYQTIADALQAGKLVVLIGEEGSLGYSSSDEVADSYGITIKDIGTLDKIFKKTAAEQEAKSELETRFDDDEDED